MGFVYAAIFFSAMALITGIVAVGSGKRWDYEPVDIIKGQRNALLYVWVTFSTMFSLAHTIACIQYAATPEWGVGYSIQKWFSIHAAVGILLTAAHIYIHFTLKRRGSGTENLWGPDRV
jgi:hypothetical protein